MALYIVGKEKALQDLERAEKLIREATDILYCVPIEIQLETGSNTGREKLNDSDSDNQ